MNTQPNLNEVFARAIGPGALPRHNGIDLIEIGRKAIEAEAKVIATGAARMVRHPHLIGNALYGRYEWPLRKSELVGTGPWHQELIDVTPVEALADCAEKIACAPQNVGLDINRLRAWRQAEAALVTIIVGVLS